MLLDARMMISTNAALKSAYTTTVVTLAAAGRTAQSRLQLLCRAEGAEIAVSASKFEMPAQIR
jgi:hypothetical protein